MKALGDRVPVVSMPAVRKPRLWGKREGRPGCQGCSLLILLGAVTLLVLFLLGIVVNFRDFLNILARWLSR